MKNSGMRCILPVFLAIVAVAADAADDEPAWRSKQIAEWSAEDANQVLFDSPWAKTFTPVLTAPLESPRKPGGIGRELGGVGKDAIGLAVPAASLASLAPAELRVTLKVENRRPRSPRRVPPVTRSN